MTESNDFLEIGKVLSAHGIKGEVKIEHWCDSLEDFCEIKNMYFDISKEPVEIQYIRTHKNYALIKFSGIDSRDKAEFLKGKKLFARREDIPIKEGHYFIEDLKKCDVVDFETEKKYGILKDVWSTGANDIYTVLDDSNKEYYVPIIEGTVKKIDLDKKVIYIKPLKGVFDEN